MVSTLTLRNLRHFIKVLVALLKGPLSTFLTIVLICPVKLIEFIDIATIVSGRTIVVLTEAISAFSKAVHDFIIERYGLARVRKGLAIGMTSLSILFLYTTLPVMRLSAPEAFAAKFSQSESRASTLPALPTPMVETHTPEERPLNDEPRPDEYDPASAQKDEQARTTPPVLTAKRSPVIGKKDSIVEPKAKVQGLPIPSGEATIPAQPFALVDFSRGSTSRMELSITFDGGSDANHAIEILTALAERGILTTFFLTGDFISKYPEIVKLMVSYGHEVGNHTMTHPHLTEYAISYRQKTLPDVDREFLARELTAAAALFASVTGRTMAPYWRAPYGEVNETIAGWAFEAGYTHVGWTVDHRERKSLDTLDWIDDRSHKYYRTADEIKARVLDFDSIDNGLKGGIILMHLGTKRASNAASSKLGSMLDEVMAKGYRFVKVSRLAATNMRDMDAPGSKRLALKSAEKTLR
jgi:peptidoglycan/xylan/chitin deacetylase (PgdA/CDA1 family)